MARAVSSMMGVVVAGGLAAFGGLGVVAAAPPAAGQQSGGACTKIESTLTAIQTALPQAAASGSLASKIGTFVANLETESADAPSGVASAVAAFVDDLKAAAAGHIDVAKLTSDAKAIGTACASSAVSVTPKGAPATGSGSTAGFQDLDLLLAGSGAIVVGGTVAALERRRRRGARVAS